MDAVELPPSENLAYPKLISADVPGPSGDSESRGSDHGGASLFVRRRDIDCSPSINDLKYSLSLTDNCPTSRNKSSLELCMRKTFLPSFKPESHGKRYHPEELETVLSLPKQDHKTLSKRSVNILSSFPCSKRPKVEQGLSRNVEPEDYDMSRKIQSSSIPSALSGKSLLVKPKRGHDGKRTDKKTLKALTNCDLAMGGNKISGLYGLKTDLCDLSKHMEELSLSELLDGSCRYSNVGVDRGKRVLNLKEDLLFSIRKVCSILYLGALNDSADRQDAACPRSHSTCSENMTDCDDKDKCGDKAAPTISVLYRPKDVLNRLVLSPGQDLDSLLLVSSGMTWDPSQPATHCRTLYDASLPPFPWSHSQSGAGAHRPSVDLGKVASTRNCSQGQWIRAGNNFNLEREACDFLSEIELGKPDEIESSKNNHMIGNLLRDKNKCLESTLCIQSSPDALLGSNCNSAIVSPQEHGDCLDNHPNFANTEDCLQQTSESELSLGFLHNHLPGIYPLEHKLPHHKFEVGKKEQCSGGNHSSYYFCGDLCETVGFAPGQTSGILSTPDISKPGHSPTMLHAAEILCLMASSSDTTMSRQCSSGAIKWPKSPSQKTMKARKPLSSLVIEDTSFSATRHHQSVKHKLADRKSDSFHTTNSSRGPIRWPVPVDDNGASPSKSERSPSNKIEARHSIEKECEDQQKLRKETLAASLGFGGTYTRAWNRQRNKRG